MAQQGSRKGFSSQEFCKELPRRLDPEVDGRTLFDDDVIFLYDKLYELAAREMDTDSARRLIEGLIEAVCKITLRYFVQDFEISDLMIGLSLKLKARELFTTVASLYEEITSYDEDKDKLLSCLKDTVELLYKLVDEEFRQARKLDPVLAFLTTSSMLDKLFKPNGEHHDILSSMAEIFDRLSEGEVFAV